MGTAMTSAIIGQKPASVRLGCEFAVALVPRSDPPWNIPVGKRPEPAGKRPLD